MNVTSNEVQPTPAIALSINRAHRNASEVEAILTDLISDLEGTSSADATSPQPSGLIYEADNLADRLERIMNLAEKVRRRVAQPKPQAIAGSSQIGRVG